MLNVLVMYLPLIVFWALLNQQMSRFVFQAERMNGDIGFYTIKADQMLVIAPFFIMVLVPVFNYTVFPCMEKIRLKTPLQKMTIGMIFASITFLLAAYLETQIQKSFISIFWIFPQYFMVAFTEVFLWVANVSFAYTEAPQSMKSVVSAMVYMSIAGGSTVVVTISGLQLFQSQVYEYIFFSGLMFVTTIVFILLAMRYKYQERAESKSQKA
jgi:dipeptide/tripeptide permease